MKTIEGLACSNCSKEIPERKPYSLTTGYAMGPKDEKICYECCAEIDKDAMRRDGRIMLYLDALKPKPEPSPGGINAHPWRVTNWPGTLDIPVFGIKRGKHNWASNRWDVWFIFENAVWHGVNLGDNDILRCRRTKERYAFMDRQEGQS